MLLKPDFILGSSCNCDDQLLLYIFIRNSNVWSFRNIFTMYGYIQTHNVTSSQLQSITKITRRAEHSQSTAPVSLQRSWVQMKSNRNLIFRLQFDSGPGWLYWCNDQWCIHVILSFHNDAHIVSGYYLIEIISFKSLSFKFVLNLKDILLNYSKPELAKFLWGMCQSKCHQACKTYSNLCFGE